MIRFFTKASQIIIPNISNGPQYEKFNNAEILPGNPGINFPIEVVAAVIKHIHVSAARNHKCAIRFDGLETV